MDEYGPPKRNTKRALLIGLKPAICVAVDPLIYASAKAVRIGIVEIASASGE